MADKGQMYIEGRKIKNFADIQRSFLFEVEIVNFTSKRIPGMEGTALGTNWENEDITLRARTCSLPSRGTDAIESNFGAMKQFFPGKPTFENTTQITFEETESQGVGIFLYNWAQMIFDITKGHSNSSKKRGAPLTDAYVDMIKVTPIRYNGEPFKNSVYFYNCWLQNVDSVSLDYTTSESVKYNATFQFDFWLLGETSKNPAIGEAGQKLTLNVSENAS